MELTDGIGYWIAVEKSFLEDISSSKDTIALDPGIIKKYDLSFEKIGSMEIQCHQLTFMNKENAPCEYDQKLIEQSKDFELVMRVLEMNGRHNGH